jgi:hypothetical protein
MRDDTPDTVTETLLAAFGDELDALSPEELASPTARAWAIRQALQSQSVLESPRSRALRAAKRRVEQVRARLRSETPSPSHGSIEQVSWCCAAAGTSS